MIKIYPSILTDSVEVLQKEAKSIQSSKLVNILQIDVVDGIYADNFTLAPVSVLDLNLPAKWQLDFHLMVEEPMDYLIEIFDHPKKGSVRALIAQIEKMSHQVDYLEEVKKQIFFEKAALGDKVLIYMQEKIAILYRPSSKMIIKVGYVNDQTGQVAGENISIGEEPTPVPEAVVSTSPVTPAITLKVSPTSSPAPDLSTEY